MPLFAENGILVGGTDALDDDELTELTGRFDREVYPVLTPLAVGPGQPFPYISGLSLSLGVLVREPDGSEERFARVKVPEVLPRFLSIGSRGALLPLEDAIAHFLSWLFPGMEVVEHVASGSPATPTSRSRTRPTICSRRSSWSFAGAGSEMSSGSRLPAVPATP